ncbi:DciA family protein [Streptomyces sp. TRM76323]|uniref:DciA family protein n=1 Tax=Streptomyces tamarix TaxID=3078565 RepID=A0ABU3QE12_9ACTN|nr:DciA family protein [Streptomyces tamarix]MDT9681009.1 DciA family protein [Streptomyces tamarix]
MSAVPEMSGVDLARQALLAAREAARKNGARTTKPKRRTGTTLRRDGREPLGLGAAITMMMTERGRVAPAAGGSVLAQWEAILAGAAPELAGHVKAVKFDANIGRLDVVPAAPAYGTKVRWIAPKLIAAANEKVPGANVQSLHVLPPAPGKADPATTVADPTPPAVRAAPAASTCAPTPPPTPPTPAPTPSRNRSAPPPAAAGPVKTGETASPGYRQTLTAHRAAIADLPERRVDPAVARAAEEQIHALLELSRHAFPETDVVPADAPAPIEQARIQRHRQAAATEAAALRRARAERAARQDQAVVQHDAAGAVRLERTA